MREACNEDLAFDFFPRVKIHIRHRVSCKVDEELVATFPEVAPSAMTLQYLQRLCAGSGDNRTACIRNRPDVSAGILPIEGTW